jgi:hypothetical protein
MLVEHERTNGKDNRNDVKEVDIAFLAWDGTRWVARINAVGRPFRRAPIFTLIKL